MSTVRCGSLASIGLPVCVSFPETTQLLLPHASLSHSAGKSSALFFLGGKLTPTSLPTRLRTKLDESPERSSPGAGSSSTAFRIAARASASYPRIGWDAAWPTGKDAF